MQITKRDGRKAEFDKNKIKLAILKAFIDVDGEENAYSREKAREIANYVESLDKDVTVEEVQDIVESKLMASNRKDVAKSFIIYRNNRSVEREKKSDMMKSISEKLSACNVKNQNANVDEKSFGGRMGEANSELMRKFALDNIISDMAKNNHLNNEIYIHDLDHYAVGDHNCFQRNTKFITNYGVKSFEDFRDGDEIKVIDKDGNWRNATVKMYGRQPMYHITFERCEKVKEVNCTRNHRWILNDGTVTANLQVGNRLIGLTDVATKFSVKNSRETEMFCFGFIIGDGCDHIIHDNSTVQARLCSNKNVYSKYFIEAKYHEQSVKDSDDIVYSKRSDITKQSFLDNKMWKLLSLEDKIALFNGYLGADGSKTTDTNYVWTVDERVLDMVIDIAPLCGYYIFKITKKERNTNYKENAVLYEIIFTTKYSNNSTWVVTKIEKQRNVDYEAWCIEEPVTHSFTLDDGVITGNCLSIPFDKLLANGFNTRQTDVRTANSINTAFQLVAVIFQLQSLQQFGGVSATHIDWTMVPYVRKSFYKHFLDGMVYVENMPKSVSVTLKEKLAKDMPSIEAKEYFVPDSKAYQYAMDMTIKEVTQAVEGMYHNLNTLQSRSGNQLPFTSINYGTCTLPEGRMVTKALLEVSIEGIGKLHKTSIFPCGIFQCMKGVNRKPGEPNYDLYKLALRSTAQRLYPNYVNVDWSVNEGYDRNDPKTYVSTMGCRTYNGFDVNGMGQTKDGRGNICPVTIIMPTLAMEAIERLSKSKPCNKTTIDYFFDILESKIEEAKDMLIERYDWMCSQSSDAAKFMYENGTMEGYIPKEGIENALKHGTLAIGQIGLAETLQILIGCDHTTEDGMKLAKRIEQLFKDKCAESKELYHLNFGVYFTPAENLCFKAMTKFKEKYGVIPNVSENKFFTNSMHVPVWKDLNPFEKIDIESQLTGYSNAGCITYVELESSVKNNLEVLEDIVNYAMDKDIPYFAINVPNEMCMSCGYTDEIGNECPMCGSGEIRRLRRVTGYLTGDYTTAFNEGKLQEVLMRVKHAKF